MKKLVVLFLLLLLVKIPCLSQTTLTQDSIKLSSDQLKEVRLIIEENKFLNTENSLLKDKVENVNQQNSILIKENEVIKKNYSEELNLVNKKLKISNTIKIGSICLNVGLLTWLVLK